MANSFVALIPARAGSSRVKHKNIRVFAGHPLLAYTISAAKQSGVFGAVVVSTDSQIIADIATYYGAEAPFLRPTEMAGERSPDIEWVEHALTKLRDAGRTFESFSILRPTSPFRQPETIRRAWAEFQAEAGVDSLRAIERCTQHPGKMWIVRGRRMMPLLPFGPSDQPWHSSQYQALPEVYVQNASLEIAWSRVVFEGRTIAGNVVMPFFTDELEGFDINNPIDWRQAEEMLRVGEASLPHIDRAPMPTALPGG